MSTSTRPDVDNAHRTDGAAQQVQVVSFRRVMSDRMVGNGSLLFKCKGRGHGLEVVKAILRQRNAEDIFEDKSQGELAYDVPVFDSGGRRYNARLLGSPYKGRRRVWKLVRLQEWMDAYDVGGQAVVSVKLDLDGRVTLEVVNQPVDAAPGIGDDAGGGGGNGGAAGGAAEAAGAGAGMASGRQCPTNIEQVLTTTMVQKGAVELGGRAARRVLQPLVVQGHENKRIDIDVYDVQGNSHSCSFRRCGNNWMLRGLRKLLRDAGAAVGDVLTLQVRSTPEGRWRLSALLQRELCGGQAEEKLAIRRALGERGTGEWRSGSGAGAAGDDGGGGSGGEDDDDDYDGYDDDDDGGGGESDSDTDGDGRDSGVDSDGDGKGSNDDSGGGDEGEGLERDSGDGAPASKRPRIGEAAAITHRRFDRLYGKLLSSTDLKALLLTTQMCNGGGVFAALPEGGPLTLRYGELEYKRASLIRRQDQKRGRVKGMAALLQAMDAQSGDVLSFTPKSESAGGTAFTVSLLRCDRSRRQRQVPVEVSSALHADHEGDEFLPTRLRARAPLPPTPVSHSRPSESLPSLGSDGGGFVDADVPPAAQELPSRLPLQESGQRGWREITPKPLAAAVAAAWNDGSFGAANQQSRAAVAVGAAAVTPPTAAAAGQSVRVKQEPTVDGGAAGGDDPKAAGGGGSRGVQLHPTDTVVAAVVDDPACLPASSIRYLHGYLEEVPQPPCRAGELRICGLVFHPELRDAVLRWQRAWSDALGYPLSRADPVKRQMHVVGIDSPAGPAVGTAVAAQVAAEPPWAATFRRHGLSRNIVCNRLARLIGLMGDTGLAHNELPMGGPAWLNGLRPCRDPVRGGKGLETVEEIKKNTVLGLVGGYVMPAEAQVQLHNLAACTSDVREELARRVTLAGGRTADAVTAWQFLVSAFVLPYVWPTDLPLPPGASNTGGAAPSSSLSMLGYGNLAALINDPRANPRAWLHDNDVELEAADAKANCMVLPISVRGLVLPVVVALRDIAPGEQLLRDYGSGWWRDLAAVWEVAEDDGMTAQQVLHGPLQGDSVTAGPPGAADAVVPRLDASSLLALAPQDTADPSGGAVPSGLSSGSQNCLAHSHPVGPGAGDGGAKRQPGGAEAKREQRPVEVEAEGRTREELGAASAEAERAREREALREPDRDRGRDRDRDRDRLAREREVECERERQRQRERERQRQRERGLEREVGRRGEYLRSSPPVGERGGSPLWGFRRSPAHGGEVLGPGARPRDWLRGEGVSRRSPPARDLGRFGDHWSCWEHGVGGGGPAPGPVAREYGRGRNEDSRPPPSMRPPAGGAVRHRADERRSRDVGPQSPLREDDVTLPERRPLASWRDLGHRPRPAAGPWGPFPADGDGEPVAWSGAPPSAARAGGMPRLLSWRDFVHPLRQVDPPPASRRAPHTSTDGVR